MTDRPSYGKRISLAIVLTATALTAAGFFAFLKDDRLAPAPDLKTKLRMWSPEENSWALLDEVQSLYTLSENDADWLRKAALGGRLWDRLRAESLVRSQQDLTIALRSIRDKAAIADPDYGRSIGSRRYREDGLTYLPLLVAEARIQSESGQATAATEALETAISLARQSVTGADTLPDHNRAAVEWLFILIGTENIFDDPDITTTSVVSTVLPSLDPELLERSLARALASEYSIAEYLLNGSDSDTSTDEDPPWGLPPLLKPQRTTNGLAEMVRSSLALTGTPLADLVEELPSRKEGSDLDRFLRANWTGESLLGSVAHRISWAFSLTRETQCHQQAIRTKLALRRYFNDHGELPATLAELVPEYLDTVPVDWIDGEPVRYDPGRGVVWSVGTDLVDNGGDPDASDDIVVLLRWVRPVEEAGPPEAYRGSVRRRRVVLPP